MKKYIKAIQTTSDVSLEVQVTNVTTITANGSERAGKEIVLLLRDESGRERRTMTTTITPSSAKDLADSLHEIADKILSRTW